MFISFEGLDGCGKGTQIEILKKRIEECGHEVVVVREPGGTKLGEKIRTIVKGGECLITPMAELLLFSASRAQLVSEVIRPAIGAGKIVLADRFLHSAFAYQGYGLGVKRRHVAEIVEASTGGIRPNLAIYLDIPIEERTSRLDSRGGTDRIEVRGDEFFESVKKGFDAMADLVFATITRVSGVGEIDSVHKRIWALASELMARSKMNIQPVGGTNG